MNFLFKSYKSREALSLIIFVFIFSPIGGCVEPGYDYEMKIAKAEKEKNIDVKIFDGEEEPPFPNLEINNQTIHGIDANKNGIRDDVEIWINRTKKDVTLRRLAKKQVRAYFQKLKIAENVNALEFMDSKNQTKDHIELENIQKTIKSIMGCMVYLKFSSDVRQEHILKNVDMIYNTDIRKTLKIKVDLISSAINYPIDPKKEDCDSNL